jgi:hypothetical protein
VNTGYYKRSWRSEPIRNGAVILNQAPYAGIIEYGRRVGRFPPIEAIARWAQRRLGLTRKESLRAAFPIAKAIAERGLVARRVRTNVMPQIRLAFRREVAKELRKELGFV